MSREYYLGLDMGVSSVGWAVTDTNYRLLRAKGKDLWGIREFDEAETAAARRTKRVSRRRRQREVVRIGLLKDYFHDAIAACDANFYQRLENSKYHWEDKDEPVRGRNGVFNDPNYQDRDYFKEYPTIFHLRQELIHNQAEHDVRLVYLALLNMFKHRGHFLNAGLSGEGSQRNIADVYRELCIALEENVGISFNENITSKMLEDVLANRDYSRTKKAEELVHVLQFDKKNKDDKIKIEFVKAMCGLNVTAKKLFPELVLDEDKKIEICFADAGYEEKQSEIEEALGESYFVVVELMKEIYDIGLLANIMRGHAYLSDARVAEYNKHGTDLRILKKVVKAYKTQEEYDRMFRSDGAGTYSAYVNSTNAGKKVRRGMGGRKPDDFNKELKKLIKGMPDDDADVAYIRQELEKETFLPKQLTSSNGVIPNQVHAAEMKKILENAEKYLPFLNEKDESGLTVSERVLKLFSFQIPYYIGPTSAESKTGWIVRKEKGQVLPWNLEQKVDVAATREAFITNLVRRCSYISGEKVLPKASLEYESYCVLNEINHLAVDGERISVELKQSIYNELFKKGKKVTRKALLEHLHKKGILKESGQLSGVDTETTLNNALTTYGKFKAIIGEEIETDTGKKMVEDIVFLSTVYGDSKKVLQSEIEKRYSERLTTAQMKRILGMKFKDWGRLSKEFLEMEGCEKATGEAMSLIRAMWENNLGLMELLHSDRFTYHETLQEKQQNAFKTLAEMQPEDLDEYYFSAPVKRMVWQTLLIIKELELILGAPPKKLFLEMTRKPDEKKQRTISRKQKFLDLYKSVKSEAQDWAKVIEDADASGTLRSKKMYLYLTQQGRCMYTGKEISLNDLFNDNKYDIDHIYPRHFVKDDNIDNNLVLVKKEMNAHKSDTYPLEQSIYEGQHGRWDALHKKGFINEEKYNRLTGRKAFSEEQQAGFIARQLVETSQGTKGVADVLRNMLPDTRIVYSKASNVSEFRQKREFPKCRSVNDFHHANDAYLNIVVGNVYDVKFTQNPLNFIQKEYMRDPEKYRYNLARMFDWDVRRGDEVAWIGPVKDGPAGTIDTVRKMMAKNTPLMTRRNFECHGAIANETLYSAKKASPENYIPLKGSEERLSDVTKYGGFTSVSTAYFFLVEHTEKKKRVRTLETVPIYKRAQIESNPEGLLRYCKEELGLVDPDVRMKKIKVQSLIKRNGYFLHISGKTGKQIVLRNAVNLCFKKEWLRYIKKLEKFGETAVLDNEISEQQNCELYEQLTEKHSKGIFAKRPNAMGTKLQSQKELFKKLKLSDQCKALNKVLELTRIGIINVDLQVLKESAHCGVMLTAKRISDANEFLLINQSITGVYENTIDLLKV